MKKGTQVGDISKKLQAIGKKKEEKTKGNRSNAYYV